MFDANAFGSTFSMSARLSIKVFTIAEAALPLSVIAVNPELVIAPSPAPALLEASIIA